VCLAASYPTVFTHIHSHTHTYTHTQFCTKAKLLAAWHWRRVKPFGMLLQCVAVRCSVLLCVAVRCSVFQSLAVCCSVLQCVGVCGRVLQRVATWQRRQVTPSGIMLVCVAVCCSVHVLQLMIVQSARIACLRGNSILGGSNNFKCNGNANTCRSTYYRITSQSQRHRLTTCSLSRCAGAGPVCSVGRRVCCVVGVVGEE